MGSVNGITILNSDNTTYTGSANYQAIVVTNGEEQRGNLGAGVNKTFGAYANVLWPYNDYLYFGLMSEEIFQDISVNVNHNAVDAFSSTPDGQISSTKGCVLSWIQKPFYKALIDARIVGEESEIIEAPARPDPMPMDYHITKENFGKTIRFSLNGVFDEELYLLHNPENTTEEVTPYCGDMPVQDYENFQGGYLNFVGNDNKQIKAGWYFASVRNSESIEFFYFYSDGSKNFTEAQELPAGVLKVSKDFNDVALTDQEKAEWEAEKERLRQEALERELEDALKEYEKLQDDFENLHNNFDDIDFSDLDDDPDVGKKDSDDPDDTNPANNTGDYAGIINAINHLQIPIEKMVAEQRAMVKQAALGVVATHALRKTLMYLANLIKDGVVLGALMSLFGAVKEGFKYVGTQIGLLKGPSTDTNPGTDTDDSGGGSDPEQLNLDQYFKHNNQGLAQIVYEAVNFTPDDGRLIPTEQKLAEILYKGLLFSKLEDVEGVQVFTQEGLAYIAKNKEIGMGDVIIDGESYTPVSMMAATGAGGDLNNV